MTNGEWLNELLQRAHQDEAYQLWLKEVHRCAPAYFQVWHTLTVEQKGKIAAYQSAQDELADRLLQLAYDVGRKQNKKQSDPM